MQKSFKEARVRRWLLLPVSVVALTAAAACAPPPEPSEPVTPWLAPGCLDSETPGAPDFTFTGRANVVNNATAYLDEGVFVEDGSCAGATTEKGTIVRAATQAQAIAECAALSIPVFDPGNLAEFGYPAPIDAWACANASEAPGIIEFSGPASVEVTMFGGTPEEPTETTVPFTGTGTGTWDEASGDFSLGLQVDDGFFHVPSSPIGPLDVYFTAAQDGAANGSFDPATGEGGFSTSITMTLVGLGSPSGMPQPCDIGTAFDFAGAIDLATGELSVSQENFVMTPPGAADCGGLGGLIAPMLVDGTNAATLSLQVFQP